MYIWIGKGFSIERIVNPLSVAAETTDLYMKSCLGYILRIAAPGASCSLQSKPTGSA